MQVFLVTTVVELTVRVVDEAIPGDAALRDFVREMITSGVEEHFGTVEELSITTLRTSPANDS